MAHVSTPLRPLLEQNTESNWESKHEKRFQSLKTMASSTPVLGYCDPDNPLVMSVDGSSKGLGAVIRQQNKPIAYASRALTPTQQR